MKKPVIYILSGLGILVLMVVVAAVIVLNLDPNRYKDYIAGKVSQQMGRSFEIQGDLKMAYYPWLHVEASGIFLENAPGFGDQPLLAADHVKIRVKTLPLLKKQLEMDTIVLKGARINLVKNKDGAANWEDLGGKPEAGMPDKPPAPSSDKGFDPANLAVLLKGGVNIQDADFSFDDQALGEKYTVSDLNLTTGTVAPGDPVDLALTFTAAATSPDISADASLKGKIFYDFGTGQYEIKPFTADAKLSGPALGKTPAELTLACDMQMDLAKDTLSVKNLQADGLGTGVNGNILLGGIGSGVSRIDMDMAVAGKDLSRVFKVFEDGPLSTQLAALPDRSFDLQAEIATDMDKGMMSVPQLAVHMLGADITAALQAENIQSETPSLKGDVKAKGPDLPLLLELAGKVQGNAFLADMGRKLTGAGTGRKKFHADVTLDVDMKEGRVLLQNLDMAGLGITVKADVTARHLGSEEAVLDGSLDLDGKKLALLLAALDQPDLAAVLDTVGVKAGFKGNYQDLAVDPVQAKFGLAGKQIPNPPVFITLEAPAQLQLEKQTLHLETFSVKGLGLDLSGSLSARQIRTSPEYEGNISLTRFNLRDLMKKLNQPLPETSDAGVFEKVGLETRFSGSANAITLTSLSAVLDDTQMNGDLKIQGFSDPDITCNLAVDQFNADRYMPPPAKDASGKKQTSPPKTPETAAAGAAALIPVETLRALKLKASLAIEDLVVSGAVLSRVRVNATAKDGILTKAPLSANMYKGTYDGKVVLDASGDIPELTIDTTLKGVEVEPLLMDMTRNALIRGTGDVTAALTTRGAAVDAMKQNLNGNLSFSFKNGAIKGFNAGKFLRSLKSLREKQTLKVAEEEETDFTALTGNPVVKNGVVFLDDLSGKSPALRLSGTGILADIVQETIDYKAVITVVETSKGQTGKELTELAGIPVPVFIKGPLTDPSITPDIKGVITKIFTDTDSEAVQQLKKGVEKELGRFLKKLSE
ncbi:MAG: AsmA family protein [Desulfotignum sp.]